MSGQYPPPNPAHPFSRVPVPSQRVIPPWGHSSQPTPGLNMVGSSMSYFGSPHMGLRSTQPWAVPPQSHPKPTETRPIPANPLFGLQMLMSADNATRIPSEYQQEESMDLSSHTNISKTPDLHPESSDVLRNGTVLNVNGELDRTGTNVTEKESVVTSVIAANPLRESNEDVNRGETPCVEESDSVIKPGVESVKEESEPNQGSVGMGYKPEINCHYGLPGFKLKKDEAKPDQGASPSCYGSVVSYRCISKPTSSITPMKNDSVTDVVLNDSVTDMNPTKSDSVTDMIPTKSNSVTDLIPTKNDSLTNKTGTELDRTKDCIVRAEKSAEHLDISENYGFENTSKNVGSFDTSCNLDESGVSFLDSSALSVDTDESKLVVAESSAEDIFGISPVGNISHLVSEQNEKSKDAKPVVPLTDSFPTMNLSQPPTLLTLTDQKPIVNTVASANEAEPQPSVENVEILLESMFNSQEENSCSSQTSCGIPQSVIVSSSGKSAGEVGKHSVDLVSPMKVEDLASTLAEDTPIKSDVKEEKREERITDDVMEEIEKKLEMLTESVSDNISQYKVVSQVKKDISEDVENVPMTKEVGEEGEEKSTELSVSELPTEKVEPGSSSNPFIEVENELEKMFAGIVEPMEEAGSESQSQSLVVSERKKPDVSKRTVSKRKKANNRRPSDSSVFGGGSSGESTPVKKRGRKRLRDMGNDRGLKKIKLDSGEIMKKKKVPKDISSDNLGGKVKGPFVHIEGPKESPSSVVVVNSGVRLDDEDIQKDKTSARRKHSSVHRAEGITPRKAYNASTLSARYNSDSADLSWVCALCHRGPHCEGGLGGEPAGDLFGPYRVPATPPVDDIASSGVPSDRDVVEEQKRRGGKYPKSLRASGGTEAFIQKIGKKSKRSQSMESVEGPGLLPVEDSYEVWLHSACAEWAPGLCVVGTSLVGLEDAVWTAIRTRCVSCGETGAGIGCVMRSCPARVHYPCALLAGWLLDPETFIARCHTHRTRLKPS